MCIYFFQVVDQDCQSTYIYDGIEELKLVLLPVAPNSEISEIAANLKTNKIRRKQKQNG